MPAMKSWPAYRGDASTSPCARLAEADHVTLDADRVVPPPHGHDPAVAGRGQGHQVAGHHARHAQSRELGRVPDDADRVVEEARLPTAR